MSPSDDEVAQALMALAQKRGVDKSFCPSEVARALRPDDWRPLMGRVRRVASTLPLRATQKGSTVEPEQAKGPIRLRLI